MSEKNSSENRSGKDMSLFRIDSHKLMLHPERVAAWKTHHQEWETAKAIYPIYLEISPTGVCNHRCTFCAVDYIGYQNHHLDPKLLQSRLDEMAQLGIKSVMFAGEGEPTLYKALPEVLDHCSEVGIDTSLTTNMIPVTQKNVDAFVRNCTWIKASINAGTSQTYSKIHDCRPTDFEKALENLAHAVATREQNRYSCTLGAQMVLLPENANEACTLGEQLKKIGLDYLVIKPYSQHHSSITRKYEQIDYKKFINLEKDLASLNGDGFNLIFRSVTMNRNITQNHEFQTCHATPFFWAYIMANGDVYGCSAYLKNERFCYGNLNKQTFREIWEGERREKNYHFVLEELDIRDCRLNCRMWNTNSYLWELNHPGNHVNFI